MLQYYVKTQMKSILSVITLLLLFLQFGNANAQCPTLSTTVNQSLCAGQSTGDIDLTLVGGQSPFTFSWSNGATTEDLTNVVDGTYTCTVTDANSCIVSITETIASNQILTLEN